MSSMSAWRPGEVMKVGQVVPDDFATLLRALHADADPRLNALLHSAVRNGWTLTALSDALGMTREGVRRRTLRVGSYQSADLPDFPLPPRWPTPMPRVRRTLLVPPDLAEKLREMHEVARTVNGATPGDDPRRRVSEEFTAALAALVDKGVSVYRIAETLGVTHYGIRSRLARHGYRAPVPSVVGTTQETYKGRPTQHVKADKCGRGHPMSGPNLGVDRRGWHWCRECSRARTRQSMARLRAKRQNEAA